MAAHIARRALLAGAGLAFASPAIVRAQAAGGVALVIGNSKYQWEAGLPNVKRDAPDIAKRLQALGLKTEIVMDVGRDAMFAAVDKFEASARNAPLAAFYFAGHGVSWDYDSYLVPADSDLSDARIVPRLLNTSTVRERLKAAQHSLLVFDSCRNNPADGWRQVEATRTAVLRNPLKAAAATPPNSLMMFSTAPGHAALDGPAGQNSPFAAALLRQLGGSVDLSTLSVNLRRALIADTQGRQLLFDLNGYRQPFMLGSGAAANIALPAGVRELPNTYAFARDNGIPLLPGLVAVTSANPQHAAKVGAFKFEGRADGNRFPEILAVLAIDGNQGYAVMSSNNPVLPYWRFIKVNVAGDKIDFRQSSRSAHYTFEWRDANSGSMGQIWQNDAQARPHSAKFTRLD
jgi:hypothetical protein